MNRLKVFDGVPHPYDKVSYIIADASDSQPSLCQLQVIHTCSSAEFF